MIETQTRGSVVIWKMRHGKANALDVELLQDLSARLGDLEGSGVEAVVLTGEHEIFSAGIDLPRLLAEPPRYTARLVDDLEALLLAMIECPRPIVAAVNGHAIAGGLVLACACDYRLGVTEPMKLGLTELAVGIPFPPVALEVVRHALGQVTTRQLVLGAGLVASVQALEMGLVDEVVGREVLLERATEEAGRLAAVGAETFAITKRQLAAAPARHPDLRSAVEEREITTIWSSSAARERVRTFVDLRLRGH